MADYDLFDLTGLPFDPPEKAAKKVIDAINNKKKELEGLFNNESQLYKKNVLSEQIKCLDSILGANGELLFDEFKRLANDHTDREKEKFRKTAKVLKDGETPITKGTIKTYKELTKLSEAHIKEVFESAGLEMLETDYREMIKSLIPVNGEKHITDLERLRNYKEPHGKAVTDSSKVTDLYAFLAYMADEPQNADEYRKKTTSELKKLCEGYALDFADPKGDERRRLYNYLANYGKIYVFVSDKARETYGIFLKYKSPSLAELFDSLKGFDKSHLLNPKYAEIYIKKIFDIFGDDDIAVAVYNDGLKLLNDPYIPITPIFHVKCNHCQNLNKFISAAEAQRVNRCSHCGKPLYKQCKKCGKSVLASLDKCPECGFVFANAAMFAKYLVDAEQALRRSDFESARSFLIYAQSADPSEKSRTDELAARIASEEKKKAEYVDWERKIKQAQQELSTLRQQAEKESKREPVAPPAPVPVKAKFCGKCGRERAPKDIFCGKCGNRLD
jgi:predicted RNA-binding Zn-ribbon protein involved in translation (DUF1610 family)